MSITVSMKHINTELETTETVHILFMTGFTPKWTTSNILYCHTCHEYFCQKFLTLPFTTAVFIWFGSLSHLCTSDLSKSKSKGLKAYMNMSIKLGILSLLKVFVILTLQKLKSSFSVHLVHSLTIIWTGMNSIMTCFKVIPKTNLQQSRKCIIILYSDLHIVNWKPLNVQIVFNMV
jgi:hypothetical protein